MILKKMTTATLLLVLVLTLITGCSKSPKNNVVQKDIAFDFQSYETRINRFLTTEQEGIAKALRLGSASKYQAPSDFTTAIMDPKGMYVAQYTQDRMLLLIDIQLVYNLESQTFPFVIVLNNELEIMEFADLEIAEQLSKEEIATQLESGILNGSDIVNKGSFQHWISLKN